MAYWFITLAIAFNVGFTSFLKLSVKQGLSQTARFGLMAVALALGSVNAYFFSRSLERLGLSTAFPVFSEGSLIMVSLIGILAFRESWSLMKALGVLAIILGIYLVNQ